MTSRHFALIFWVLLLLLAGIRTAPAAELKPYEQISEDIRQIVPTGEVPPPS